MLQSNKNKTYRGRFDHLSVSIAQYKIINLSVKSETIVLYGKILKANSHTAYNVA